MSIQTKKISEFRATSGKLGRYIYTYSEKYRASWTYPSPLDLEIWNDFVIVADRGGEKGGLIYVLDTYVKHPEYVDSTAERIGRPIDLVVAGNYTYIANKTKSLAIYKIETTEKQKITKQTEKQMTKQEFLNKIKEVGDDKAIDLSKIEPCEEYNQWCKVARDHIKWSEGFGGKAVFIDNPTDIVNLPTLVQIRFYNSEGYPVDELNETWLTERVNELSFKEESTEPTPTKPTTKLSLSRGWNIISSPIEQPLTISDIEEFCSLKKYKGHKMWVYDPVNNWTNPEQVESNEGVYVYSNSDCVVESGGEKSEFGEKELKSGWNLISAGNNSVENVKGDCKIIDDKIWEFDAERRKWIYPGINENLDSGKGYWVKVKSKCTLKS